MFDRNYRPDSQTQRQQRKESLASVATAVLFDFIIDELCLDDAIHLVQALDKICGGRIRSSMQIELFNRNNKS